MSVNSSKSPAENAAPAHPGALQPKRRWSLLIVLPLWTLAGFFGAQLLAVGLLELLAQIGVTFEMIDATILNTSVAAVIYILALVIVIGVPLWLKKYRTSWQEIGLQRPPSWLDIGVVPPAYVVYMVCLVAATAALTSLLPSFDLNQAQVVGFDALNFRYEYVLAFITLVILAPVAEEILLRGYLYGKLRNAVPIWLAAIVVSALFGALHGQWNVAVDTFILSIVMCGLREFTGSIWARFCRSL